jgi:hypothetical protein
MARPGLQMTFYLSNKESFCSFVTEKNYPKLKFYLQTRSGYNC